jgi:hypothetical protein
MIEQVRRAMGSLVLAACLLALTGCSQSPTAEPAPPTTKPVVAGQTQPPPAVLSPTQTTSASPYRVLVVPPVLQITRNDEYYFDNCSGDYPVTRSFAEAAQVTTALTLAEQASALSGETKLTIPAGLRAELEAEIAAAYGEAARSARALVAQTTLFCDAHNRNYTVVIWEERVYASVVSFSLDGVAYSAEYSFVLEVPRPGTVKPGICTP